MNIHEPATLVTDLLLAAIAGFLAHRLRRSGAPAGSPARAWSAVLALTALSAVVGGAYHGFAPDFGAGVADAWWVVTLWVVCLLAAAMATALLYELVPPAGRRPWRLAIAGQFAVFAALVLVRPQFVVVIADYGLALLAWTAAAVRLGRPWRTPLLVAVGLSVAAAGVQQSGWSVSAHFNHNDLYHLIQAGALFAFYRAARRMRGPPVPAG